MAVSDVSGERKYPEQIAFKEKWHLVSVENPHAVAKYRYRIEGVMDCIALQYLLFIVQKTAYPFFGVAKVPPVT